MWLHPADTFLLPRWPRAPWWSAAVSTIRRQSVRLLAFLQAWVECDSRHQGWVLGTCTGTWSVLKYHFQVLVLVLVLGTEVLVLVPVLETWVLVLVLETQVLVLVLVLEWLSTGYNSARHTHLSPKRLLIVYIKRSVAWIFRLERRSKNVRLPNSPKPPKFSLNCQLQKFSKHHSWANRTASPLF